MTFLKSIDEAGMRNLRFFQRSSVKLQVLACPNHSPPQVRFLRPSPSYTRMRQVALNLVCPRSSLQWVTCLAGLNTCVEHRHKDQRRSLDLGIESMTSPDLWCLRGSLPTCPGACCSQSMSTELFHWLINTNRITYPSDRAKNECGPFSRLAHSSLVRIFFQRSSSSPHSGPTMSRGSDFTHIKFV